MVQGLRYSVESHAMAYQRMHQSTLQRGFHALACQRRHPATLRRDFHTSACQRMPWQLRYTPVFDLKPSRNNPCPPATISSQLRPHDMPQHGTKTILQSIPIHPKSKNKPTSISIHKFLVSILKTKTTNQRGKNPIPRCKSNNSTHIPYKTKDPYKFHTRIHTKLQRSIQFLLITFCVHVHVSCLFYLAFKILVLYDAYVFKYSCLSMNLFYLEIGIIPIEASKLKL